MALAALEQRKEEEIKSAESRLYSQHRLVDIYLLAWWYIAKKTGHKAGSNSYSDSDEEEPGTSYSDKTQI